MLKQPLGRRSGEPADKYGVHFEYQDLFERLLVVKKTRERQNKNAIFKSFDGDYRKTPSSGPKPRHKSKNSIRSNSLVKTSKKGINSDLMRVSKIYSPNVKKNQQKLLSPDKYLGSIRLPISFIGTSSIKKRISRSRVYNS
ncbi:hypothetical protein SteCoe_11682 [Stentor coeruleus]|uniref:Uncharacterized protein n=1 Tax=Stentor coeruleus TaxID=5963 RepID=A0A1R2CCN2_9CILI|nr:hypothetical protein SteCoe_11682 [Stentor coeruleus]